MASSIPSDVAVGCVEEQLVWVYCSKREETDDVLSYCRASQRPRRTANIELSVSRNHHRKWRAMVKLGLPSPLYPYSSVEQDEFWSDACTLLAASAAAAAAVAKGSGARWPPLLVTDHEKLYQASTVGPLRGTLAELARMRESWVLTVVLAADFGALCGAVISGSPLDRCEPLSVTNRSGTGLAACAATTVRAPTHDVDLQFGVFVQRLRVLNSGLEEEQGASSGADGIEKVHLFGARCLAMFADGRCAYCAVSPDGARSVEASGRWKLVNGHIVLLCCEGAGVSHFRLGKNGAVALPSIKYSQPIHIPVEEVAAAFESPIDLKDCLPKGGNLLRLQILEDPPELDNGNVKAPLVVQGVEHTEASALTEALDSTFNAAWDTIHASVLAEAAKEACASDTPREAGNEVGQCQRSSCTLRPPEPQNAYFLRTPLHALMSLANPETPDELDEQKSELGPAPRLFGFQRGITGHLATSAWEVAKGHSGSEQGCGSLSSMQAVVQQISPSTSGHQCPSNLIASTCDVRPGVYKFESKLLSETMSQKLEITLHADGACDYYESCYGCSLRSTSGNATWRVSAGVVYLNSGKSGVHGFLLRESKGSRTLERRVGHIEINVEHLLTVCSFTPFEQSIKPFPCHTELHASRRVFGVIDPESPALEGLKCRPDRLPYHAFERELRRQGLQIDEILSDFRFVDRDADGQVSVADLRRLDSYGIPVAAPEVLEELREALMQGWGSLASAFEAIGASVGAGRVTASDFENFFASYASKSSSTSCLAPPPPSGQPPGAPVAVKQPRGSQSSKLDALKEWVQKTSPDDRAAVFASLNPESCKAIDLTDFLSLNLHSAVLSVRRLQHFQSWLFDEFGRTSDIFRKVFLALGPNDDKVLTRKRFQEGAKSIGYPCDTKTLRSMFYLLDRNLDGEVSSRDFVKLIDFSADDLLRNLDALKQFTDAKLGGIEAAFEKFVMRERILQSLPALPKNASYEALQKTCTQAGFFNSHPDADVKSLFLFLKEASGGRSNEHINFTEWSLLKAFSSKAITGSPARLRRIIQERYGNVDNAFERMHTAWLRRALAKGLKQTAVSGLIHALSTSACIAEPEKRAPSAASRPSGGSARPPKPDAGSRSSGTASERQRSLPQQKRRGNSIGRSPSAQKVDVASPVGRQNSARSLDPPSPPQHYFGGQPVPPPLNLTPPGRGSSRPNSATSSSPTPVGRPRHRPPALLPRPDISSRQSGRPGYVSASPMGFAS